jgi:hypothetical protein
MKSEQKPVLFVELTAQEAETINGGRHGADDGPNHDLLDDKGGLRGGGRNGRGGADDPLPHN